MSGSTLRTSPTEVKHLAVAWLSISLAFAVVNAYPAGGRPPVTELLSPQMHYSLSLALVTVGAGFLLHELGHKLVAQRYGCWAEFRASFEMLLVALFGAWAAGVLFAAPGAVRVHGTVDRTAGGHISAAGPLTNLSLAGLLYPLTLDAGFAGDVGRFGVFVNLLLAGFNMLPLGPLDGRKVVSWSRPAFAALILAPVAALAYLLI
ncbi:MAG: hypothetical protein MAG715_00022 [Methanonatronarchaeales archaeon]|nr:hypothetical protein [Methanonatronarchaeales archaeon]